MMPASPCVYFLQQLFVLLFDDTALEDSHLDALVELAIDDGISFGAVDDVAGFCFILPWLAFSHVG